jgi:secreted Zn-dependent insulinase-like peptidase
MDLSRGLGDVYKRQEVFNRYSSEIINRTYLFNRKEILLQQIKNITFNDLKNFIERIINNNNCIKIIIKGH